jgi:cyclophilin family peptidyl-prolyl cis-trans isomerase/protein-disulfide isomerase
MRSRFIALFAVLLLVVLAACTGTSAPATTPSGAAPTIQPTSAPAQNTPASVDTPQPAPTAGPTPDIQKVINPQPDDWSIGPKDAKVTIIEWADYQCPYCAVVAPLLKRLADAYPNDVQFVYRHFPLTGHDKSLLATQATEAAGAQGKFWEMHDLLFASQPDWAGQTVEVFRKTLSDDAAKIGLDVKRFDADVDQGKFKAKAEAARDLAIQLGIGGTPFLLINQQPWPDQIDYRSYINLVGMVKLFVDLPKMQFKQAPEMKIDKTKTYQATLKTDQGDIVLKLYADKAPLAVNNFVFLAKQGWYDGVMFHRVISGFVAQAGDPTGLGFGGPGYTFANDVTGLKFDKAGLIAMANADTPGQPSKGTNGSQFFITLAPAPDLDAADPTKEAKYSIFGEVTAGMDVVNKLTLRDPQQNSDTPGSLIKSIEIQVK